MIAHVRTVVPCLQKFALRVSSLPVAWESVPPCILAYCIIGTHDMTILADLANAPHWGAIIYFHDIDHALGRPGQLWPKRLLRGASNVGTRKAFFPSVHAVA